MYDSLRLDWATIVAFKPLMLAATQVRPPNQPTQPTNPPTNLEYFLRAGVGIKCCLDLAAAEPARH